MLEYMQDDSGVIYIKGEAFDHFWGMRGYGLLMDESMMVTYIQRCGEFWLAINDIKPDDFKEKIEGDIRSLIDSHVLKEVPYSAK